MQTIDRSNVLPASLSAALAVLAALAAGCGAEAPTASTSRTPGADVVASKGSGGGGGGGGGTPAPTPTPTPTPAPGGAATVASVTVSPSIVATGATAGNVVTPYYAGAAVATLVNDGGGGCSATFTIPTLDTDIGARCGAPRAAAP